jgi:hypothetical protein
MQGFEGGDEEGSLAGEGLRGGVAGAAEDGAPGEVLHQAEAGARACGREGGDGDGVVLVEGVEEAYEPRGGCSEIRVGEQEGVGVLLADMDQPEAEGVAFIAALPWG